LVVLSPAFLLLAYGTAFAPFSSPHKNVPERQQEEEDDDEEDEDDAETARLKAALAAAKADKGAAEKQALALERQLEAMAAAQKEGGAEVCGC
jgi:flagellar biosynthesis/type III secretory pathway M-ring protein FliF/YscJ